MLDAPVVAEFDTQQQIRHRDPPVAENLASFHVRKV
jgi:hypothetical protein